MILMRSLIPLLLLTTAPLAAQDSKTLDRRVGALENQMHAVQRKVFPGATAKYLEPEVQVSAAAAQPAAAVSTDGPALATLTARVDALEARVRELTGQVEQAGFQTRTIDATLARFRADAESRLTALENGRAPGPVAAPATDAPPPDALPATTRPAKAKPASPDGDDTPPPKAASTDPQAQYEAAYALYEKGDYPHAAAALKTFADAHPKHPRASNAQYWYGRALMAQGQPAQAAKAFLDNYKTAPKGERAPNSLLWLGKSLIALRQPKAACSPFDQLRREYPDKINGLMKTELDKARAEARCIADG